MHAALRNSSGESTIYISECKLCETCGFKAFSSYINNVENKLDFKNSENQNKATNLHIFN